MHSNFIRYIFFLFGGMLYFMLISYLDDTIIRPLVLHEDPCYYHTHEAPFLISFFYMGIGSNGHPDGSLKGLLFSLILSFYLAHLTVKKIRVILKSQNNQHEN